MRFIEDAAPAALKADLESCRSSLSTAEKESARLRGELRESAGRNGELRMQTGSALEKALGALRELRQQVEDTIMVAQKDEDTDGWITAYHFKTGAIHRLLAKARDTSAGGAHVDVPKAQKEEEK